MIDIIQQSCLKSDQWINLATFLAGHLANDVQKENKLDDSTNILFASALMNFICVISKNLFPVLKEKKLTLNLEI